jgi:hypothetical protein
LRKVLSVVVRASPVGNGAGLVRSRHAGVVNKQRLQGKGRLDR